jgi:4-methyl-5(b-hydroxyethyl)-thiazole monophosphate biosynthesis
MQAIFLLPENFGEMETFTVLDILHRANMVVKTVSLASSIVTSSGKRKVLADKKLSDIDPLAYDIVILPGGPGYRNLLNSGPIIELVRKFNKQNKIIAAVGEAPVILAEAGVINDKIATVMPGYEKKIPRVRDAKVVIARNIITARGPLAAADMAIKLVEIMSNKSLAAKIRRLIDGSS